MIHFAEQASICGASFNPTESVVYARFDFFKNSIWKEFVDDVVFLENSFRDSRIGKQQRLISLDWKVCLFDLSEIGDPILFSSGAGIPYLSKILNCSFFLG